MPHSVRRVIADPSSIFVSISLCCKSNSRNQPRSAVDPLGFTSDSSPGREGGSEEGVSPSGHPSSSTDKRLLTPQWPCTPGTPKRHLSTRARHPASLSRRCHPLWSVGILCVIPGPVKCGSWDRCQELASPLARYHLVLGRGVRGPPGPRFTHDSSFRGRLRIGG